MTWFWWLMHCIAVTAMLDTEKVLKSARELDKTGASKQTVRRVSGSRNNENLPVLITKIQAPQTIQEKK